MENLFRREFWDDRWVHTDHHLAVDVDHEAARLLRPDVVGVGLGLLRRLVLALPLHLAVANAEEGEVVPGAGVDAVCAQGLRDIRVHHLHGAALPVEDGLHRRALRHTLGPHGYNDVDCEPLAGLDFAHDLERELLGHQVQRPNRLHGDAVRLPREGAAEEVLVLDVDEVLGAADGIYVCVLDAAVDDVVLSADQPRFGRLLRSLREAECGAAVDGAEELYIPGFLVLGEGDGRRGDDDVGQVPDRQEQVLSALLAPPLLEVVEHVPGYGTFEAAVNVVPRLPRAALGYGGAWEVGLVEIVVVGAVQRAEERVDGSVVASVAEVEPTHEADYPAAFRAPSGHGAVHYDDLLVVGEHGGDLQVLHETAAVVGVTRAEHAVYLCALKELLRLLIVGGHQPVPFKQVRRRTIIPDEHEHAHALVSLPLQQLSQHHVASGLGPGGVPHQGDLGVDGPPSNVDEMPRVGDRVEDVFPAAMGLVLPAAGKRNPGDEAVGNVRVLVKSDFATPPLGEEGVGHAGELGAANSEGPVATICNVEELELNVDLGLADGVALLVKDLEPAVYLFAVDDLGDGQVSPADVGCSYGGVELDGEDDVGGMMAAVDVEGLVPSRVLGLVPQKPSAGHPRLLQVHGRVHLGAAPNSHSVNQLHEKWSQKKPTLSSPLL